MKTEPLAGAHSSGLPHASGDQPEVTSHASRQTGREQTYGELRAVRIAYFDPAARDVFAVGSFNGWDPRATPMQRRASGDWSVELRLPPGEYRYRLLVDSEWRDDPTAERTAMNPYGGFDAVLMA